jgi:CubicO group peptidase (beta-lactamase class C family)
MNNKMEQLNKQLEEIAEQKNTVSMSAAALYKDDVIWTHALGMSDQENSIEATSDTVYRIASVSKHVSCIALMTLVEDKLVELDTDISEYLGYSVRNPYYPDVPIKLRHLMSHTSTIIERGSYNRIASGEMLPYKLSEVLPEGALGYRKDNFLNARPGEKYDYSSFGTGILGAIIERKTGIRFAEYVREKIFIPLNLDASFDPNDLSKDADIAVPYEVDEISEAASKEWLQKSLENKKKLSELPLGEAYRIAQGNLHICARDLAVIMQIFFFSGKAQGVQILTPKSVQEMIKPQFIDEHISVGFGLNYLDYLMPGLIGHYGRSYGAFTMIVFNHKMQKGVVVLMNGTDPKVDKRGDNIACKQAALLVYRAIDSII